MDQIKSEIIEAFSSELKNTLERLIAKVSKTVKIMKKDESFDDYDFDIDSFVSNSTSRIEKEIVSSLDKIKSIKGTKKPKRDPNAPKRPRSSYILFSSDNRSDVKSDNPDMSATEITKEVARLWRDADEDVKSEYKEKALEDKKRYEEEMENYLPSEGFEKEIKTKKSKEKDPNAPKKPCTAYIIFSSDFRKKVKEEEPTISTTDITKRLAQMWKDVDDKTKSKYEKKALEDKKRYEEELKDYNSSKNEDDKPKHNDDDEDDDDEDDEKKSKTISKEKEKEKDKKTTPKGNDKKSKPSSKEDDDEDEDKKSKHISKEKDVNKKTTPILKEKDEKKSKPKELNDENKKKSKNPFINFCNEKRDLIKEENPDAKPHEITKIIAELWKDLDEDEKNEYK
jgi:hypothetical protein